MDTNGSGETAPDKKEDTVTDVASNAGAPPDGEGDVRMEDR